MAAAPKPTRAKAGVASASCGSACHLAGRMAFVFWYGAIAQLGERVLCKHEVVGSIPSGSTTLRPSGFAWRGHAGAEGRSVPGIAQRATTGLAPNQAISSAKHHFARCILIGRACGISDIVKRR